MKNKTLSFLLVFALLWGLVPSFERTEAAGGDISTVAGVGINGFTGDSGLAVNAQIGQVENLTADPLTGDFYIVLPLEQRIRKVDGSTGIITTIVGTGTAGFSGDSGLATSAEVNFPRGLAIDNSGNLYFADGNNNRVRRIDAGTGIITTIAGTGVAGSLGDGGLATAAQLNNPTDVAFDSNDDLYVVQFHSVRKIDMGTGNISTVVGTNISGFSGDGGAATAAQLDRPYDIIFDGNDNMYIADWFNDRIRRVDAITGNISTIAGSGVGGGYSGDGGPATSALLNEPTGVDVDADGDVYIADLSNSRVRKVDMTTGIITTVAGTAGVCSPPASCGDGGPATSAPLFLPADVSFGPNGHLLIGEIGNFRVRQVDGLGWVRVLSFSPSIHQTNVAASSNITLVFSESLNTAVVNQSTLPVYGRRGGLIPGSYSFSTTNVADDTVIFDPTTDFQAGERVTVSVSTSLQSATALPMRDHVFSFWVRGGSNPSAYQAAVDYPMGSTTGALVSGDFNNDQDLDLVALLGGSMQVMLGNGDGTFTNGATVAGTVQTFKMVAADFDRDGNLDIARGHNASVAVHLGNGDGTFDAAVTYATTYSSKATYAADMNGDGILDIVTGTFDDSFPGNGGPAIFLGNGDGTFQAAIESLFAPGGSYNVGVMDYNNDGRMDVLAPNYWDGELHVYRGNGDGTLTFVSTFAVGGSTSERIEAAPLNSDAFIDLADSVNGSFERRLGDGTGAFPSAASVGSARGGLELADMDGDGDVDIVTADFNNAFVRLYRNNGSASFVQTNLVSTHITADVVSGDFNEDGYLDIAATVFGGGNKVSVYLATPANAAPATTTPTAITQATDGSGFITFQTTVSDADSNPTRLKVEYSDNGGSNYYDAELVSATPNTGTVSLNNAVPYQIGSADAIDTNSGAKTLTIVWNSQSASNGNGAVTGEQSDLRLRVTPNDSTVDGTAQASGNFTVDNQDPTGLTALVAGASTSTTQELTWSAVTETNFDHYEIWYGSNQSDVVNRTGTAQEWDNSDDAALATISTTTTTITSLNASTSYFFKVFAVDDFGNEETVTEINLSTFGQGGRRRQAIEAFEPAPGVPVTSGVSLPVFNGGSSSAEVDVHEAAGGEVEVSVLEKALKTLRALDQLFAWMEAQDYQLTVRSEKEKEFYAFVLHTKRLFRTLAVVTGYSDGYSYRFPDQEPIVNVAELMKVIMISFSDCYADAQFERVLRHDYAGNGWWWAGYSYFLDPLMERFFGEQYLVWAPIDQLNMLEVLEVFLTDYCSPVNPS